MRPIAITVGTRGGSGTLSSVRESGGMTKVLIVDENPLIHGALGDKMTEQLEVDSISGAFDAVEALALVGREKPALVVVDIAVGNGQGIDLIKRIVGQSPDSKVLVYSMFDEVIYAERALQAGAHGFVHKRSTPEEVVRAIERVLDGGIALSPLVTDLVLGRSVGHPRFAEGSFAHRLSDRELEVFTLIGHGVKTRQIGERLGLSVHTIQSHREKIKQKLGCKTGSEMARHAIQWVMGGGPEGHEATQRKSGPARNVSRPGRPSARQDSD